MASNLPKNMIFASFGVAGLVSVLAILDIVTTFPFAGSMTMDILFLLSTAIVGHLAWDAFKDMARSKERTPKSEPCNDNPTASATQPSSNSSSTHYTKLSTHWSDEPEFLQDISNPHALASVATK